MFLWSVQPPCGEHLSSYRLHVRKFHTGILACVVLDDIFICFSHRSPKTFRFIFHFQNYFLKNSLLLPWWSSDLENVVENQLHLAIDQHPVCPNRAGVNSDLGNGSFCLFWGENRDAKHVDWCRWKSIWFDRINWPLTSKDVYFFGNACIGLHGLKAVSVPMFVTGLGLVRRPAGHHRD